MKWLDLTLAAPAANLACDEALLDFCEEGGFPGELLRFWEPCSYFVVVGYANKIDTEVDRAACEALHIPILRRCSGGGTVLQGPGCLNYSLVLRIDEQGDTRSIHETNRFVMGRNRTALERVLSRSPREGAGGNPDGLAVHGHTDLTLGRVKFSGNAQRRRRHFLLFHGTLLLDFDLALIEQTLRMPSLQPAYREGRSHHEFVRNLPLTADAARTALRNAWEARDRCDEVPRERIERLVIDRYATPGWNDKF